MILGFQAPTVTELFEFRPLFKLGGLAVTYPIVLMFGVTILMVLFFQRAFAKPQLVPAGVQNVGEVAIDFVRDQIALPALGPDGARWVPFLSCMFYFVLFNNLLSIVPGAQFPVTSLMGLPVMLAVVSWVIFNYLGIKEQGFIGYFKGIMFPPGVPKIVYILLSPIELLSTVIVRPVTLAVRLFANMVAGHMILAVLFLGTETFLHGNIIGKAASVLPFALGTALTAAQLRASAAR